MQNNNKDKITAGNGFTLVEIMIVVAIIGLLAAIAIPNFVTSRVHAQATACINNLRCIDGAKQQWAVEMGRQNADIPQGSDLQPYLGTSAAGRLPTCPVDGANSFATSYSPQSVGTKPVCLILSSTHLLP